jgi:methionyl-tRNA formyltransferase
MIPIVFFGTPEFACPTLAALIESDQVSVKGVLTQPDRPRGRGLHLSSPPVKLLAERHSVPVLQPQRLSEPAVLSWLRQASPEAIVVVAYAGKIPPEILHLVPKGCLNLHPSLLPRYRGGAPIQWALMRGETETGNTTIFLSEEWDAGDIVYQEPEPIRPDDNYGSLSERLARKGASLMLRTVLDVAQGVAPRRPQDESQATWARLIKPQQEVIDWPCPAIRIHNQVRALSPTPGARTRYRGTLWKILRTEVPAAPSEGPPGTIADTSFNTIRVHTGDGLLEILEIQPAGKRPMPAMAYLRGHPVAHGDPLG